MSQPIWNFVSNLGDVNPIDHGGHFVYIDKTGVYDPEAVILLCPEEDEKQEWTVHRYSLDKCTFIDGILSDNKFHPECSAWFAKPESERADRPQDTTYLKDVADCMGTTEEELTEQFCSDDVLERARAYHAVGSYHGWNNLDDYPLQLTRTEVTSRYGKI